ncbi:MAG: cytochrome c biogenesis protein CcsA [Thermodesulfobacteriota bacterium]
MAALLALGGWLALSGLVNLAGPRPRWQEANRRVLLLVVLVFFAGFGLIVWLHQALHQAFALELPAQLGTWLNNQLAAGNLGLGGLPAYDPGHPPRDRLPYWIENEKYFFWFWCFAGLSLRVHGRTRLHRLRAAILLMVAVTIAILAVWADPFRSPLPRFFAEVQPWLTESAAPVERLSLFMRLYPRLVFYYNASYMWIHPPLLFIAYAGLGIFFVSSVGMLFRRDAAIEAVGYEAARLSYSSLTLGMLLGLPWALTAWGPNWWWDPKIASSIMLWLVFSTALHTRLYKDRPGMWYFTASLGVLSFVAMIFTFVASFLFPGEHTFQ